MLTLTQPRGCLVATHDPRRYVQLMRDHLAAHDNRLVFLFGAGTSSAVNIAAPPQAGDSPTYVPLVPALDKMTLECKNTVEALSGDYTDAWRLIEAECQSHALGMFS